MTARADRLARYVRRLAAPAPAGPDADAVLLDRYRAGRDEAAFAALVARHGPMVLGACRRLLPDPHEAEDAFQATFLVLARKAASVRPAGAVAAWLHGVACRVARGARAAGLRRRLREAPAADLAPPDPRPDPLAEVTAREALRILDEEVTRLPAPYRLAVLLCCLEGLSQEEAAARLGWTPGSVKGRLERGRGRLHARLVKRGLVPSAALAAAATARATPAVPASITARAVLAGTPGGAGGVTARAAAWAGMAVRVAVLAKLKFALALVLALGAAVVAAGGLGAGLTRLRAPEPEPPRAAALAAPAQAKDKPRLDRYGDPLPPGALTRLGTLRFRPGGGTCQVLFLADGKKLITAGRGGMAVCFWDRQTGKLIRRLPGDPTYNYMALSPDGRTLAVGGWDKTIRLLHVSSGKQVHRLEGHRGPVRALAFSPDGRLLASGGGDKAVRVWDVATGREVRQLTGHEGQVGSVVFSPDGKRLASSVMTFASETDLGPSFVRLWDVKSGRELRRLTLKDGGRQQLLFTPDGRALAIASDAGVSLWDANLDKVLRKVQEPDCMGYFSAISPDGKALATATIRSPGLTYPVFLWDLTGDKRPREVQGQAHQGPSLAFSPDGSVLASVSVFDGVIRLWDVKTGRMVGPAGGHEGAVTATQFLPGGKLLVTGSEDEGVARLWDRASGKELRAFVPRLPFLTALACSPDGKILAAGGVSSKTVRLVDVATGRELRRLEAPHSEAVAFSPDGKVLASSGLNQGGIRLWDVATGRPLRLLAKTDNGEVRDLAFSPDGKLLAAGRHDYAVQVWDLAAGLPLAVAAQWNEGLKVKHSLHGLHARVAFSPDGRMLAVGRPDGSVTLWELATGRRRLRMPGHADAVMGLAFAPDGRTLAGAGDDGTVRLWDAATGRELDKKAGHRGSVRSLALSPDGKLLATGGGDTTALLWDVAAMTGRPPARAAAPPEAEANRLWADLADPNAARAYRAIGRLARASAAAVTFFKKRLRPVREADPGQITALLAELEGTRFTARENASRKLIKLGDPALPGLRRALARSDSSLELRRRAEQLVDQITGPSAEHLRQARAVEALEQAGTAEARELLQALSLGMPGARLTEEARASLRRLERRGVPKP
jgi:RNA polymerase sigma factor (sigma-70 family)